MTSPSAPITETRPATTFTVVGTCHPTGWDVFIRKSVPAGVDGPFTENVFVVPSDEGFAASVDAMIAAWGFTRTGEFTAPAGSSTWTAPVEVAR